MPYCFLGSSIKFQGHTGWNIDDLNPIWVRLLVRSQLSNPSDLTCLILIYQVSSLTWAIMKQPPSVATWTENQGTLLGRGQHTQRIHQLTHWGRVTHICVANLTIIGSDNGLSPSRRQAIIWTNAGILLIGPLWTNFREILIKIITFSFKKMRSKVSSGKGRPSCLSLNVLRGGMAPIMGIFFIFIPGLSFLDMLCIFEKQATFLWDTF